MCGSVQFTCKIFWIQIPKDNAILKILIVEVPIDHTVGKNLHGWKNDIDNGATATEMCPDIKAIGIWLAAIENL